MRNSVLFFFILVSNFSFTSNEKCDTNYINALLEKSYLSLYSNKPVADSLCTEALCFSECCNYKYGYYWGTFYKAYFIYELYMDYTKSIELIENNLSFENKKDSINQGVALYYLFNSIIDMKNNNYGISTYDYLQKSIHISKKINNNRILAYSYCHLAFYLVTKKKKKEALNYIFKADSLFDVLPVRFDRDFNKINISLVYFVGRNYKKAQEYCNIALNKFSENPDTYSYLYAETLQSLIEIGKKNFTGLLQKLERSDQIAKDNQFTDIELITSLYLNLLYAKYGNYKKAYYYFNKYTNLKNPITSVNQAYMISNLRKEHEVKRINEVNKLKLQKKRITQGFISIVSILVLFFAIIILGKYKKLKKYSKELNKQRQQIIEKEKEQIQQKLEYKKRELTTKTLKIFHTNQLIDDLSVKLSMLRSKIKSRGKTGEELRNDIQSMLNEIRLSANNKIWKEVEYSFNEVNPDFVKWLNQSFPDLTPNEIKLCIFSMLHLNIKDICVIWMKSYANVQVTRTRLRKKLRINDSGVSISKFLSNEYEKAG